MLFITLLQYYAAAGLAFAAVFFLIGYKALHADAAGTAWHVRLVWLPAAVGLWPLLMVLWLRKALRR